MKGNIYFASANSGNGFVSYFREIFGSLSKLYIIKGGPGTGKSSFIKAIAREAEKRGKYHELFMCSSDPFSFDGIIIPELSAGVIDGTPPHNYEAEYPGIVERVLDFGSMWNEEKLRQNGNTVIGIINSKKENYKRIYNLLSARNKLEQTTENYTQSCIDIEKIHKTIERITKKQNNTNYRSEIRLIKGITSEGEIYYDSFEQQAETVYKIKGKCFSDMIFLNELFSYTEKNNISSIISPYFLDSRKINGMFLPETKTAFVISPSATGKTINTDRFVDKTVLMQNIEKIKFYEKCITSVNKCTAKEFKDAADKHKQTEEYYTKAMDFSKKEKLTEEVISELFNA